MEAEDRLRPLMIANDAIFPDSGLGSLRDGAVAASFDVGTLMAYLLRSLAVIGVIAAYSPVHGERTEDHGPVATVRSLGKAAAKIDAHSAMSGLTAARETAQILAGLDPETRQRLMAMTAMAAAGRGEGLAAAAGPLTR